MLHIGVDEAGRGPLFGRVYSAAVILPKEGSSNIDLSLIKDSKKFTKSNKIKEVAKYIKENALYWNVEYVDEDIVDKKNIREATFICMHKAIKNVLNELDDPFKCHLNIDGNAFKPLIFCKNEKFIEIPYTCIVQGDAIDKSISAASILAKTARDEYIENLCDENPELEEKYDLRNNKGYGTKKHREGIAKYGRTKWHRQTFKLKNI